MESCLFNVFLMVDWSANSTPKSGADSIWYCLLDRSSEPESISLANPSTRLEAYTDIRDLLYERLKKHARVLIGFDFAYGYPQGTAQAMQLKGPPWLAIWRELYAKLSDNASNGNNRYVAASMFNQQMSSGDAPFWGCPESGVTPHLSRHKPKNVVLPEFRITDRRFQGPQPVWKLSYPGSVGSQALLGIPYLYRLRFNSLLKDHSTVWPFETGLSVPTAKNTDGFIVHAEIYPSFIRSHGFKHPVKDARQVLALARHFSALDESGELLHLFRGAAGLTDLQRQQICREEGWILGAI